MFVVDFFFFVLRSNSYVGSSVDDPRDVRSGPWMGTRSFSLVLSVRDHK